MATAAIRKDADDIQLVPPERPDRLPAMLFLAALIHGILIIGVTFNPYLLEDFSDAISLEVTIVADPDQSIDRPDEAEYLAQTSQLGTGNTEDEVRPSAPLQSASPIDNLGEEDAEALQEAAKQSRYKLSFYVPMYTDKHSLLGTMQQRLERHGVNRIVVGHTPTFGVVWPEYEGRTVVVDTGISDYYGGNVAYLEITADARTAGYLDGKLPLPEGDASRVEYLEAVIALNPDNKRLLERLELLKNPPPVEAAPPADAEGEAAQEEPPEPLICGTS